MTLKNLIKFAELIKDKKLRDKTIKILKNPKITNKAFKKYKKGNMETAPAGPTEFHHGYTHGLLVHTVAVTELCIELAKLFKNIYKYKINMDYLICAALLHDYMKVFMFYIKNNDVAHSGTLMDHGIWACCELYKEDFPEEVIHIIASHFGEEPLMPKTKEALILSLVDELDSKMDNLDTQEKLELMVKEMGKR